MPRENTLKNDGEIKQNISATQKRKEFITSRPTIKEILKSTCSSDKKKVTPDGRSIIQE